MRNVLRAGVLAGLLATAGFAQAAGLGIGLRAGTQGAGVEFGYGLTDVVNIRLGFNRTSIGDTDTIDGIRYDVDLGLESLNLMFDWHPFGGTFRLTAGYVADNTAVDLRATPTENVTIGSTTYTPAQVGTLSGRADLQGGAYLGIGWGNVPARGFGFTADVGVFATGSPDVRLSASSGQVSAADLRSEERDIEDDVADLDLYPVIAVGFSYGF